MSDPQTQASENEQEQAYCIECTERLLRDLFLSCVNAKCRRFGLVTAKYANSKEGAQRIRDEMLAIISTHTQQARHKDGEDYKQRLEQAVVEAQIEALDHVIGIYNYLFEPNGEFKAFNQLSKNDVAELYLRIGEYIRQLEGQLAQQHNTQGDNPKKGEL